MINSIAGGLTMIFVAFAFINLVIFIQCRFTKKYVSMVGPIGGFCGCVGFLLIPRLTFYAWVPLIADLGMLSFMIASPRLAKEFWETSRFNLIGEYVGSKEHINVVHLRLFKKGICVLRRQFQRGDVGLCRLSMLGTWRDDENKLVVNAGDRCMELVKSYCGAMLTLRDGSDLAENNERGLQGIPLYLRNRT